MELEKLEEALNNSYNRRLKSLDKRVTQAFKSAQEELSIDTNSLSLQEVKTLSTTILDLETKKLKENVEALLLQKEQLEKDLEKASLELQNAKYEVFNTLEVQLESNSDTLSKLHQVKLQSIDLYDILSEMVESAIITALEKDKDGNISQTTEELIKEVTFEAIKEGSLNTIRIRKILATILQSSIDIAEATPNRAEEILGSVLRGMRSGLISSIGRFKKRLAFMPVEAKHILIEDYDTIIEDLHQTDTIFSQVILTQASESSQAIRQILVNLNKKMKYDLEELLHISKEAAEAMKNKFSEFAKKTMRRADSALHLNKASEAKRMGKQAWGVAKTALENTIKSAKDVMKKENKENQEEKKDEK